MGRIVEVLVGLNALGGIAAFLGYRHAGRKAGDRLLRRERTAPPTTPAAPQQPPDQEGSPPSTT
jgi:hypothetical protein